MRPGSKEGEPESVHPALHPDMRMRPSRGSFRVRAWIYTVINPLAEACERDLGLLRAWNLTWRRFPGQVGAVRAARAVLSAGGRLNLDDLLRYEPSLSKLLEMHEAELAFTLDEARETFLTLCADEKLRAIVIEAKPAGPWAAMSDDDAVADVAESLIDGDDVAREGVDADVWARLRPQLEGAPSFTAYRRLKDRIQILAGATAELQNALAAMRRKLCDEFDLPPAPDHDTR